MRPDRPRLSEALSMLTRPMRSVADSARSHRQPRRIDVDASRSKIDRVPTYQKSTISERFPYRCVVRSNENREIHRDGEFRRKLPSIEVNRVRGRALCGLTMKIRRKMVFRASSIRSTNDNYSSQVITVPIRAFNSSFETTERRGRVAANCSAFACHVIAGSTFRVPVTGKLLELAFKINLHG